MQKTIFGFYQDAAKRLELDIVDLLLLRWFVNFLESRKIKYTKVDSKKFYWVNYKKVAQNYPILNIKKDAVYRRFRAMSEKGILEHYTLKKGGTYSMYRLDEKYYSLLHDTARLHEEEKEYW